MFNGVFYNLDAESTPSYAYQEDTELYEFYEELGSGAFSTVYKAIFLPSGEEIAVKVIKE